MRTEYKYHLKREAEVEVLSLLNEIGTPIEYEGLPRSRILSIYYESERLRQHNGVSVRLRSYLCEGYCVQDHPAVVDIKFEPGFTMQQKARRKFDAWKTAHELLSSNAELICDMLPEILQSYGPMGALSPTFGVEYVRKYFELPDNLRVTLDTEVKVLHFDELAELKVKENFEGMIMEAKLPTNCLSKEWVRLAHCLGLEGLRKPPSKRTIARKSRI